MEAPHLAVHKHGPKPCSASATEISPAAPIRFDSWKTPEVWKCWPAWNAWLNTGPTTGRSLRPLDPFGASLVGPNHHSLPPPTSDLLAQLRDTGEKIAVSPVMTPVLPVCSTIAASKCCSSATPLGMVLQGHDSILPCDPGRYRLSHHLRRPRVVKRALIVANAAPSAPSRSARRKPSPTPPAA